MKLDHIVSNQNNTEYYLFGSENSLDVDIMIIVKKLGSVEENKKTVKYYENILSDNYDKKVNCNLAIIENNELTDVFKGTADEANNSIYMTYRYHKQNFPLRIQNLVSRDVDLKVVRGFRIILSLISRSVYRPEVKKSLKGLLELKMDTLMSINLCKLKKTSDLGKNNVSIEDFYKNIAFQLGQTRALLEGMELYTKSSVYNRYPELRPFLMRESDLNIKVIEKFKNEFIDSIRDINFKYQSEPK